DAEGPVRAQRQQGSHHRPGGRSADEKRPRPDIFLQIKPRKDFEALWTLRALVKGVELDAAAGDEVGIPLEQLKDLAQRMKTCKFGILFFGMGLSMTRGKHLNVEAALSLARDLNEYTRFYAKPMRGHGNVT